MVVITTNDKRTSPSGSVSSTNDSGYSISPASPSSLHVKKKRIEILNNFYINKFLDIRF